MAARNMEEIIATVFPNETEILILDNTDKEWDCFSAIRLFLQKACGDLIVIAHDDVEFGDLTGTLLIERISEIIEKDPTAALFGVAGISNSDQGVIGHFHDASGEHLWGFRNGNKACSLDECFFVISRKSGITVSKALEGYHFYGTDLCINAMEKGFSSYVVDFPITHNSTGNINEKFFLERDKYERHLLEKKMDQFVKTTCTVLYGGKSKFKKGWALALSLDLIVRCNHKDKNEARKSIYQRGYSCCGKIGFDVLVSYVAIIKRLKRIHRSVLGDYLWWRKKNWRVRIGV